VNRPASARWAWSALIALVVVSLWLAIAPAVEGSRLVLASVGGSPDWLIGIFRPLGAQALAGSSAGWTYYLPLMLTVTLWGIVVWLADQLGTRLVLAVSLALIAVFLLAPPLLSQDVFSYIAYARLGVVHELNPYAFRPFDIPADPVFPFAGSKDAVDVYGPFFTLGSYPLGWLSVPAAFWLLKAVTAFSVVGIVLLVRSLAERLGSSSARAIALVGLSPATLVHVVAGAHNEALTMLIVFAGIAVIHLGSGPQREPIGGFVSTLAIGIKASAAVPLVFMLAAAKRRVAMFWAMFAAAALTVGAAYVGFGSDALGGLNLISSNQDRSSRWSVPHKAVDGVTAAFGDIGRSGATDVVRLTLVALLLVLVGYLVTRSWRHPETWLANAGWATLGVLVASAWLVPWYLLWLLPFAALGKDARLQVASVVFCAYTLVIAIPF
jgi:hypothetical protein